MNNQKPSRLETVNFMELMTQPMEPLQWVIPGYIPEGLTLLAAKQKSGKSFLMLGMSIAKALGGYAVGKIKVEPSDVLYLALEDGPRRMQARGEKILQGSKPSARLKLAYSIGSLTNGGLDALRYHLDDYPDTALLTIDVLSKVMKFQKGADQRDEVYRMLGPLQHLAIERHIGVVAIHHMTKDDETEDDYDLVYGSGGYTQVADTVMIMKRRRGNPLATLSISGRDVEESTRHLQWVPDTLSWVEVETDMSSIAEKPTELARFLLAIKDKGPEITRTQLATVLDKKPDAISQLQRDALEKGCLASSSKSGNYMLTNAC